MLVACSNGPGAQQGPLPGARARSSACHAGFLHTRCFSLMAGDSRFICASWQPCRRFAICGVNQIPWDSCLNLFKLNLRRQTWTLDVAERGLPKACSILRWNHKVFTDYCTPSLSTSPSLQALHRATIGRAVASKAEGLAGADLRAIAVSLIVYLRWSSRLGCVGCHRSPAWSSLPFRTLLG